jgi:hypothetical protein
MINIIVGTDKLSSRIINDIMNIDIGIKKKKKKFCCDAIINK